MNTFPDRKSLNIKKEKPQYQDKIVDSIKSIDVQKIDFTNADFKPRYSIIDKQKVFFWIRIYLKEESTVTPDDDIQIKYLPSGEVLNTKFICYSKKGVDKDSEQNIISYETEDDKKVLCLMVDSDKINYDNEDIPFIKTLFKTSRFYEYQLLRREDLEFTDIQTGETFDYFDVSF